MQGYLDIADGGVLEGWVRDLDNLGRAVGIEVVVDGVAVGRSVANVHRRDLEELGVGTGRHGYRVVAPAGVELTRVTLRRGSDGAALPGFGDAMRRAA